MSNPANKEACPNNDGSELPIAHSNGCTLCENKGSEEVMYGAESFPCCKICLCENGKRMGCACHREQLEAIIKSERKEERGDIIALGIKMANPDNIGRYNQGILDFVRRLKEENNG